MRHLLVPMLAALVLAGDDDAGRNVDDAHGALGLVDVLAAGAARPERRDLEVGVLDLDQPLLLDQRPHLDGGERGLAPLLGVEGADPDEPMRAGFVLQPAERVGTLDLDRHLPHADLGAVLAVDLDHGVARLFRPAHVHAVEHAGPVLRLRAPGAGVERDERPHAVGGPGQERLDLEPIGLERQRGEHVLDLVERRLVALGLGHVEEHARVVEALAVRRPGFDRRADELQPIDDLARRVRRIPESLPSHPLLEFPDLRPLPVEVKDSS